MDSKDLEHHPERLELLVEALLFSSERPVSLKELTDLLPEFTYAEIRKAILELRSFYERSERSFELIEVAGGYQFRTRQAFAPIIQRFYKSSPYRLSDAAVETLAIIAYRQPISRNEIEAIRGVDVSHVLKVLIEKGLIRIVGKKELPGRPLLYGTTKKFLEVFGLKDITCLPDIQALGEARILQKGILETGEKGHERDQIE